LWVVRYASLTHPTEKAFYLIADVIIQMLQQDLYQSLSPHHLGCSFNLSPLSVKVPLLVCGSMDDIVVDPNQIRGWQHHFQHSVSRHWLCPSGRHFFHYFHPELVSQQIAQWWIAVSSPDSPLSQQQCNEASTGRKL
jgi:pimeloyl-ACP methyl ester carboxylesterase